MDTSRVRLPPTGTRTMALEPPFSSLHYCSEVPGPEASSSVPWPLVVSPRPQSFLPAGIGGDTVDVSTWRCLILTKSEPGDVSTRRRLNLATPHPGDASTWQCLSVSMPHPGDASSGQPVEFPPWAPLDGSHYMFDFDPGQRPGTGRYIYYVCYIWFVSMYLAGITSITTKLICVIFPVFLCRLVRNM